MANESQPIELFKSGQHTDSAGNTRLWSQQDVRDIARIYNEQYPTHEAPAVLGHPEHDGPAYGYVNKLFTEDRTEAGAPVTMLMGTFRDFQPEFVDIVKKGLYKKRSIALYSDKLLRHVGWLGATPPAIKGLANPTFASDKETITFEFSDEPAAGESSSNPITTMDPEVKAALDEQDKKIDNLTTMLQQVLDGQKADEQEDKLEDDQEKGGEGGDAPADVAVGNGGLLKQPSFSDAEKKRLAALEQDNAVLKNKLQEAEFKEFLDSDEVKTRVLPAQRQSVLDTMRVMAKVGEHEFADGKKESALERYKKSILAGPELVQFGEIATAAAAATKEKGEPTGFKYSDGKSTYDEGRREKLLEAKKMADEKKITFNEAVQIVMNEVD